MIILISAAHMSLLGAMALQTAHNRVDRSGFFSVAGYIAYIISFSILEFALISQPISYVLGLWAASNLILSLLVGWIFYAEQVTGRRVLFNILILIGCGGLILSS